MPLLPMFNSPTPKEKDYESVRGYCVVEMGVYAGYDEEEWPEEFCSIPRTGDFVRSNRGNTLKVIQVTHIEKEDGPIFELLLGQDRSSGSPMEGGAAYNGEV